MTAKTSSRANSVGITATIASSIASLPNLSQYNDLATVRADFLRGIKWGRLTAVSLTTSRWTFYDETAALDLAIESTPLSESMSFAFLKGFAAEFRHSFRLRYCAA